MTSTHPDTIDLHLDPSTSATISVLEAQRQRALDHVDSERLGAGLPEALASVAIAGFYTAAQAGLIVRSILLGETRVEF